MSMTNEDAIRRLYAFRDCKNCNKGCYDEETNTLCPRYNDAEYLDLDEAIDKAIEALEVLSGGEVNE